MHHSGRNVASDPNIWVLNGTSPQHGICVRLSTGLERCGICDGPAAACAYFSNSSHHRIHYMLLQVREIPQLSHLVELSRLRPVCAHTC